MEPHEKDARREAILKMATWTMGMMPDGTQKPLVDAIKEAIVAEAEIEKALSK